VDKEFGVSMSWLDKLRLLAEVGPLLGHLQAAFAESDPHKQALALIAAGRWAAGRTETTVDDEALQHIEAIVRTPEAQRGLAFLMAKLGVLGNG
jgi:hypothetical protein